MGFDEHGLTIRQARLVDAVLDPEVKSITEAAKRAGYAHRPNASTALQKTTVRRAIAAKRAEALDLVGAHARLTAQALAAVEREGVDSATKALQFLHVSKGSDFVALQENAVPEAVSVRYRDKARTMLAERVARGIIIALRWPDRAERILRAIERRRGSI